MSKGLTTRQRKTLDALMAGGNQKQAAGAACVSERTVRRYLGNPAFVRELRKAQNIMLGDTVRRMSQGADDALTTLLDVMQDKNLPASIRVRAALGWLSSLWKAKEMGELAERIADLEEKMEAYDELAE